LICLDGQISGRLATDHRLLLAAIHSEVHPVSWLRGKCWVRHREKIENLQEWKKKPDHFHYSRLFDPYIKREYEMIRTTTVTNGERRNPPHPFVVPALSGVRGARSIAQPNTTMAK
jgi:hypothetical protein